MNPLCGDECHQTFNVREGRLTEIRASPRGCAISRASTSMMTDAVAGKTVDGVHEAIESFKHLMLGPGTAAELPKEMEDIEALEGVKVLPARSRCAILGWDTILDGMKEIPSVDSDVDRDV